MFSRELENDYGTYSIKNNGTVLLKGHYDINFRELESYDPTIEQYKVFLSNSINFAIRIGNSTYIPLHIFDELFKAYTEGNPYYTIKDVVTIDLDISKTLDYIGEKYGKKQLTKGNIYLGINENNVTIVNSTPTQSYKTRFEQAGVLNVEFQFYKNNNPYTLDDENIIKFILFLFEESNLRIAGIPHITIYEDFNGKLITENLPTNTAVVPPVTNKINFIDEYLRDVKRT